MKLFVFEYITSGALCMQILPRSLAAEGDAMLCAILNDMSLLDNIEFVYMRDQRLVSIQQHSSSCIWIDTPDSFQNTLLTLIDACDYVLAIAPETDNVLYNITQLIPAKKLLGCDTSSIKLCSDKGKFANHLHNHGLASPNTQPAQNWLTTPHFSAPIVIKPFDGAGCEGTHVFQSSNAASDYLKSLASPLMQQQLVQRYVTGMPASLSLFIDAYSHVQLLNINQQFF